MSFSSWPRAGVLVTLGLTVAACKGDTLGPDKIVASIEISPKTARMYAVGEQKPFSTTITTEAGTAGEGIEVGFISRNPALVEVNSSGIATVKSKGGSTYIVAAAGGKADSALVEVPATSCGTAAPRTMSVGEVVTDVGATGFCAAGGSTSAEYAVIVHNNSFSGSGNSSVEVTGVAVGTPPASRASFSKAAAALPFRDLPRWRRDVAAEMRHRRAQAAQVAPLMASATAWYQSRAKRATLASAPPAVDDIARINVSLSTSCNDSIMIDARVAAVSNSAIVLADPHNPSDGYTDAEYDAFAQMFDAVINPLDVSAFGAPTDLDNNQRVLLVFTKEINKLTPAGAGSYVGGLTHSRDLFPKTVCAASNVAEMFYLLVPDSLGEVNGDTAFTKKFVGSVTDATVAHEYQHLINLSRRMYINNPGGSQPREELWLNEGLSHIAEELLYYRRSGYEPMSNIGAGEIFDSQAAFDLFVAYMAGDFLNYDQYVRVSALASPFGNGDELETRGAVWSFLRYLADQGAASDSAFWYNLVNSGDVGTVNLQARLGVDAAGLRGMLRDFTIAVYADDNVPNVAAKYTQPSWNMRSIYPGLKDFVWPMEVVGVEDGVTSSLSLRAGGFKVYRFRGTTADSYIRVTGASGSALPSGIVISIVRTQ